MHTDFITHDFDKFYFLFEKKTVKIKSKMESRRDTQF